MKFSYPMKSFHTVWRVFIPYEEFSCRMKGGDIDSGVAVAKLWRAVAKLWRAVAKLWRAVAKLRRAVAKLWRAVAKLHLISSQIS